MLRTVLARLQQGHRTSGYPKEAVKLPDRFRGRPRLNPADCQSGCTQCVQACPTDAISRSAQGVTIDLGKCLFCTACEEACPAKAVRCGGDHRLAARTRDDLLLQADKEYQLASALDGEMKRLFGRALRLRQVSAGGCNGCEVDINVLSTVVFDLARFGIQIVASPRHADGVLITGAVSENMRLALEKTYAAVPKPKLVIAVGACAISGGPFAGHPEVHGGAGALLPVDLFVPGCPPHPLTILDGLLRLLGRL
jgi:Ni,Fe-hydrogenase III small subunit/Fe-S-cluster-containing hydrogenase component 2